MQISAPVLASHSGAPWSMMHRSNCACAAFRRPQETSGAGSRSSIEGPSASYLNVKDASLRVKIMRDVAAILRGGKRGRLREVVFRPRLGWP